MGVGILQPTQRAHSHLRVSYLEVNLPSRAPFAHLRRACHDDLPRHVAQRTLKRFEIHALRLELGPDAFRRQPRLRTMLSISGLPKQYAAAAALQQNEVISGQAHSTCVPRWLSCRCLQHRGLPPCGKHTRIGSCRVTNTTSSGVARVRGCSDVNFRTAWRLRSGQRVGTPGWTPRPGRRRIGRR